MKVGTMDIAAIKIRRDYRNALKEIEGPRTANGVSGGKKIT